MHYLELWAKSDPYHPLWCHLLDTGAVCKPLMDCLGCPEGLPDVWTMYLAALHDIGKADPEFQVLNDEQVVWLKNLGWTLPTRKSEFRHESRSGVWMLYHLRETYRWDKHAARVAAEALRGHHGNFRPKVCGNESIGYDKWEQTRTELARMVADVLCLDDEPFASREFTDASSTGVKLIGLTVLSDWIASNEELFRYRFLDTSVSPSDYWRQARAEADRAVNVLRLGPSDECAGENETPSFRKVWPSITDLRPSQQTLENACVDGIPTGLAIIEAPMGEGKTESAMYLSECWRLRHGSKGAYIALPTTATSNQMHRRYRDFLSGRRPDEAEPRLVHGMAWLLDDIPPEKRLRHVLGMS